MLNGTALAFVPGFVIAGLFAGYWLGTRYNRWAMRILGALLMVGMFYGLCLPFQDFAYAGFYSTLWIARFVPHDVANSLLFDGTFFLLTTGFAMFLRSTQRGKRAEDDMALDQNYGRRSVKMALLAAAYGCLFLLFAGCMILNWVSITKDDPQANCNMFTYVIAILTCVAVGSFVAAGNRLWPGFEVRSQRPLKFAAVLLVAGLVAWTAYGVATCGLSFFGVEA